MGWVGFIMAIDSGILSHTSPNGIGIGNGIGNGNGNGNGRKRNMLPSCSAFYGTHKFRANCWNWKLVLPEAGRRHHRTNSDPPLPWPYPYCKIAMCCPSRTPCSSFSFCLVVVRVVCFNFASIISLVCLWWNL